MKTPLRGKMLRGADFIIEVVSARVSDSIQTIFEDACISDDKTANGTKTWSCSRLNPVSS